MRFWSGFTPLEIVVYLLGAVSIVVLAFLANAERVKGLESISLKKVAWGLLAVVVAYWVIAAPDAGAYERDLSSRLRLKADLESASTEAKYIHDHHYRIEELEHEIVQARSDIQALNQHYRRLIQLLLAGVFVYAASFILTSRRADDEDQFNLGLDEQ
jgi:hypothetical protein